MESIKHQDFTMKITLIGAGNLATNLGKALVSAGHEMVEVYSRTQESADALAACLGSHATTALTSLSDTADAYIIAVKDSALQTVVTTLSEQKTLREKVFFHTAGSVPMAIFEGRLHHYGVFYPMQTFSKDKAVNFREIPVFVEGSDEYTCTLLHQLAASVSAHVHNCSSEQRKQLHLAAVFACNFVNHCYALSEELLHRQGLDFSVMLPLIDETARKVHALSPQQAQTGPAVRYDENIISMQLAMLDELPAVRELYQKMSESIHRMATEQRAG